MYDDKKLPDKLMAAKIIQEADEAFNTRERQNARKPWQRLSRYVLQTADGSFNDEDKSKGHVTHQDCYDSSASNACRDLASALHSTLTNPAMRWSKLRMLDDKLNDSKNVVAWLDKCSEVFHNTLNDSNFDTQIGIGYLSYCGLGTKVLLQEENFDETGKFIGFKFKTWYLGEVAYCENSEGKVDTVYRKFTLTVKQAMEKFKDNKEYVEEIKKLKPTEELKIYHIIKPRPKNQIKLNSVGLAAPNKRPFASVYVDCKTTKVLLEEGYYELPIYVSRISTKPAEIYGFGPGHIALPDILSLNKIRKVFLKGLAKAVDPFIVQTQRNLVEGNFNPGTIVTVKDINSWKEGGTNSQFAVAEKTIEDYRNSINRIFYLDKLLLPPRTETGEMSAYEVRQRLEQMQQVLGPMISRLNSEFLTPFVLRSLRILLRNGMLPPIPEELKGLKDVELQISFVNSLARSQQLSELSNIQAWLQEEAAKAQINPQGLDLIDFDEITYYTARIRNIPEGFLRSTEEVKALRDQRNQQMQMQQALQMGEQGSNIAKNMKGSQ